MLSLHVTNETSRIRAVVLGTAISNGPVPAIEDAYDPKSIEHIKAGTYPKEEDMLKEIEAVAKVFKKYDVTVFRPKIIENCNQIFARDIAFVIDNKFIKANILPDRERELEALQEVMSQINPNDIITPPEAVHIEGGDVMLWNDYIFIGTYKGTDYSNHITARTNMEGVNFIKSLFPDKTVKEFDLAKSKTEARDNALHLDCCFQPVGKDKGIIYKDGFRDVNDYLYLVDLFGEDNLFHITRDEMYNMYSNVFSIAENVVISEENFKRLNTWLRSNNITVEEVPYAEISKQEGLLRCSTMPLIRD
ncbi:NG,NG-dimethylarginine dimethylaminohydrolase 1 [Formosa agariphila KMM 3901]|uniref:arginine deiminase n=1 Tax=Formosa agariphila (strain DSM 15362 / KCTC 12365 / LMG 23005 / KMM 3901 / M-2Alg 35-1) TaxID=1347342 RepID=T2KJZ5_FORAG|nr:arginine deiminase family protein [Formosa agariphila]CDF78304.1 NG,NG-dimethylarginine dimethylaminohydrolase 1 [Formosa agariphila KMM 3901]